MIVLPWPSKDLSPNARVHWARRAKAVQHARHDAYVIATAAGWRNLQIPEGRVHLRIEFYPPTKNYPDDDNMLSRFKAYRDGIADAMVINDRRFVSHPIVLEETRKHGQVVVRIIHQGNHDATTVHAAED